MLCPPGVLQPKALSCHVYDDASGGHITCYYGPCQTGRRPEGLVDDAVNGPDSVARYLAQMAHLEAASVDAFERLARELRVHRAPARLCGESRRAARDEVRHARVIGRLAKRAGATVPAARVEPCAVRSLEAIAVENVVEGCVRETFGAAVAMFQANRAGDERVRRAMKGIARDEARHAELSWKLASWLDEKLDSSARARVKRARTQAVAALAREVMQATDRALNVALGIPTVAEARALIDNLRAPLWS
jgi:rubrerythrin